MVTIRKRETSLENIQESFEDENMAYGLFREEEDKNVILSPKIEITEQDLNDIPALRELHDTILQWEEALKRARGQQAYTIKRAIIEMRKDQYVIKQSYKPVTQIQRITKSYVKNGSDFSTIFLSYLIDPSVAKKILNYYGDLRHSGELEFRLILDDLATKAFHNDPIRKRLYQLRLDGYTSKEISEKLQEEFNSTFSIGYITHVFNVQVAKKIARQAEEEYLMWLYKSKGLPMRQCKKCGEWLPEHKFFFSCTKKGNSIVYLSVCKSCRNKYQKRAGSKK